MCRREANLFFFTLGDGSLPLGRNCASCVFEKSRNRVVLDGGDFEILWRKTTSTISPLEWHLPNNYTLHMLKKCWCLYPLCVFSPTESYFSFLFLPDLFLFMVVFAADMSLLSLYTVSISGYLNAIKHVADQSWCLCGRDACHLPWWKDSLGLFLFYTFSPLSHFDVSESIVTCGTFEVGALLKRFQFYREILHKSLWCVQL